MKGLARYTVALVSYLWASAAYSFGPVVLLGVDAEDGFDGTLAHGPVSTYSNLIANGILPHVTNGGSGILVLGAGKDTGTPDQVTSFWSTVEIETGLTVTMVNGGPAITSQLFSGFALIAVASTEFETASGGLTQAENDALGARQGDLAAFVNGGGGLFGLSQQGFTNPYQYVGGLGAITLLPPLGDYDTIEPTPEGIAVGVDSSLSVCCWHDGYDTFPGFLQVLALGTGEFNPYFGEPVALGGAEVTLPGCGDGAIGVGEQCDDGNVSDGDGCSASCMLENTPPDCMGAAASLGSLWPPNHKYVSIGIEGVSDPDGDPVSVAITSIFQDEPTETIGDGNNCPDATGTGTDTASIRSERSGTRKVPGDGRVYHIGFTADDGAGGECSGVVTVCVPHDRGGAPACVDQGALFDSTLCGDR